MSWPRIFKLVYVLNIDIYFQSDYIGGTLIICPASLINQWEKEVENRVKRQYCSVRMHHGNNRETNARQLSKHTMVITTYGVINSEQKNRVSSLPTDNFNFIQANEKKNEFY